MHTKPTAQEIIDATNRATDELLKNCPSHGDGYSALEEKYFATLEAVRELNRAAARAKREAKAAA